MNKYKKESRQHWPKALLACFRPCMHTKIKEIEYLFSLSGEKRLGKKFEL